MFGLAGFILPAVEVRGFGIGEVFELVKHSMNQWQIVVVTEVLDGQPGCWLVRKRWLVHGDRLMCLNAGLAEQSAPAAMRQAAA